MTVSKRMKPYNALPFYPFLMFVTLLQYLQCHSNHQIPSFFKDHQNDAKVAGTRQYRNNK